MSGRNQAGSLVAAAEEGNFESVRMLLGEGADPNISTDKGITPLHRAANRGYRDIVGMLVSAGANVNAKDGFGRTALHHAVVGSHIWPGQGEHDSIVSYLLVKDIDVEARGESGLSAMNLADLVGSEYLGWLLHLASRADLAYVRRLALSIAASPAYQAEHADQLIVTALLEEKGIDTSFEPLVTAFLNEVRRERPQPTRSRATVAKQKQEESGTPQPKKAPRRSDRFIGIPPEKVRSGRSWVISGYDSSIFDDEVHALEAMTATWTIVQGDKPPQTIQGNTSVVINMAVEELHRIDIDEAATALDAFNHYFRETRKSAERAPEFERTLLAALILYTDDRFFRRLNDRWREGRSGEVLGFSTLMSLAFRRAPYFMEGEVYRGVDLADVEHYVPGLIFRWPFFVSASKSRSVASQFGQTLVAIEVRSSGNVREISRYSLHPNEEEVLFRAYETFEVIDSSPNEVRIRVFHDEFFGTGWEVGENREIRKIE